jgi:uncharacterized protein (TIGR03067 family)
MFRGVCLSFTAVALTLVPWADTAADKEADKQELIKKDLEKLQGEWEVASATVNGGDAKDFLSDDLLIVKDEGFTFSKIAKGNFTLDPTKKPKSFDFDFDLYDQGNATLARGIYEVDGESFTICFSDTGDRPEKFAAGARLYLLKFKRKPQK